MTRILSILFLSIVVFANHANEPVEEENSMVVVTIDPVRHCRFHLERFLKLDPEITAQLETLTPKQVFQLNAL